MKYNLTVEIPIKVVELVVPVHNEAPSLKVFFKTQRFIAKHTIVKYSITRTWTKKYRLQCSFLQHFIFFDLQMDPIKLSVCPWQDFPVLFKLTLKLIGDHS